MSILIGLTGNIGSGKTLAASYFNELGTYIIDADLISRQLVLPHEPAWEERFVWELRVSFLCRGTGD